MKRLASAMLLAAVLLAMPASRQFARAGSDGAPGLPDGPHLAVLIYATLGALNQANVTGNYSVVRDLAAPDFQKINTPARLAVIFFKHRQARLDFATALIHEPSLTKPAAIDEKGLLHLTGFIPSEGLRLNFDFTYQRVDGRWRLFGLTVSPARQKAS